ncbi:sentrin-specific protease 1-like [Ornithodoros turicata]|uniref:sentrin-specific protease 1-like n=1 Tax=Ornithodoros turicata TaxID=34597 RepID=UPI003138F16C
MLTEIGATFRRLFSGSHGDAVSDRRRKRKRNQDEFEGDDPTASRRKQARYDFQTDHRDYAPGWIRWAVRKPLRNYFVNSVIRCFWPSQAPVIPSEPRLPEFSSNRNVFTVNMPKKTNTRLALSSAELARPSLKCDYEIQNSDATGSAVWVKPADTTKQARRRPAVNSRPPEHKQLLTPYRCINLKEKEEFRLLLQHFNVSQRFGRPKRKPVLKDASTMATEALLPSAACSSLQQSSALVPAEVKPKKLHHNTINLCDLDGQTEEEKKEESTQWVPVVPKTTFSKTPTSPYFSPRWVEDFKEHLTFLEEDKLAQIKKQEQVCQKLRAQSEKERQVEDDFVPCVLLEDVPAEEALPELTSEMEAVIDNALSPTPPDEVLASGFRLTVTRRDMETLAGLNWLNDEVINFYMNLLVERGRTDNFPSVYAFNTFFYPKLVAGGHVALKRWTRKVDLFSHDLVLVPVHLGAHWCLAVIDFRSKTIQYYDSMGGSNPECLEALRDYLKDESLDKRQEKLDMSEWTLETVKGVPQQMNGSDCGMFALKYAEYITRDAKITFSQMNMPYFRRRMVYEILTKRLL